MTEFHEFILPEYSVDADKITSLPEDTVCVCCLGKTVRFVNLATCKHRGFLTVFAEFKNISTNSVICQLCHNMLKKIEEFRRQVKQSILVLNKQSLQTPKPYNLGISVIETMTVASEMAETLGKHEQEQTYEYEVSIADVKLENDTSDMETDTPLLELKRQKAASVDCLIVKKEMNSKYIKREKAEDTSLIGERYMGKVEMFLLTPEELQKERELMKVDEKYLILPFKCEKCVVGFKEELQLTNHCKQRHDDSIGKYYICEVCGTFFVSKMDLDPHYRRHFIRYECKTCSTYHVDEQSVITHYNEKHGGLYKPPPSKFKCDKCDKLYSQRYGLRMHMQSAHGSEPPPYCDTCRLHFRTKQILQHHLRNHSNHITEEEKNRRRQMQSADGTKPPPYCVPCRKHFTTHTILQYHLKHHSQHATDADKKYACDECGVRFTIKAYLKGHIEWAHMNKSDYRCQQCLKYYRTSTSLRRHIELVHDKKEMPLDKMCDYCGKGFSTLRCLQAHIRTHTGERPYQCGQCAATFTQSAALYNHKRLVHNPLRGDTRKRRGKQNEQAR